MHLILSVSYYFSKLTILSAGVYTFDFQPNSKYDDVDDDDLVSRCRLPKGSSVRLQVDIQVVLLLLLRRRLLLEECYKRIGR